MTQADILGVAAVNTIYWVGTIVAMLMFYAELKDLIETRHKKTLEYIYRAMKGEEPTPPSKPELKLVKTKRKGKIYKPSEDTHKVLTGDGPLDPYD